MNKHAKICQKVFVEKRKAFDMAEMRKPTDANGKGLDDEYAGRRKPPVKLPVK